MEWPSGSRQTRRGQAVNALSGNIFEQALPALAAKIRLRTDTFTFSSGRVVCELGGTFTPTCGEMEALAAVNFDEDGASSHSCGVALRFSQGEEFSWNGPVASLYTAVLRNSTHLESVALSLSGAGIFEVSVFAHKNGLHKLVQRRILTLDAEKPQALLPELDLATLPPNTALYVNSRCLSEVGVIAGFRWLGYVQADLANLGERVYLIRTYNGRPTVRLGLSRICGQLARSATGQAVLKRTLFVIYDATPGAPAPALDIPFARVLELKGPNCGGGGNSSFLVSLLLRLGGDYADAISDLLIMDDDARIDAETLIRQDAFITARKQDVVSASVVYNADKPLEIQEAGGYWGKFISPVTNRTDAGAHGNRMTTRVYLIRQGQVLDTIESVRDFAIAQQAEFGAFIFISFPYRLLLRVGAPYPLFLRNDDVELCLRCLAAGATLAINPNLHAWHIAVQKEVSEFYSILHGLILNAALGHLQAGYIVSIFLERAGKIARAGNCALLQAYALALEKFVEGPDWHQPARIYGDYLACQAAIRRTLRENTREIPFRAYAESQTPVSMYNCVDCVPAEPEHELVIFQDVPNWRCFQYDPEATAGMCEQFMGQIGAALATLAANCDSICAGWREAIARFDHLRFWNELAEQEEFIVRDARDNGNFPETSQETPGMEAVRNIRRMEEELPADFNEGEYVRLNPDVASARIPPRVHWLRYGRKEGRRYK